MTEIEKKALELVNEVLVERGLSNTPHTRLPIAVNNLVLLRAIEQHEAFRQEVSDALKGQFIGGIPDKVAHFIITKPDPLVDAIKDILDEESLHNAEEFSDAIREALAKRGLEIREKE